jgi:murein L,D-transpeptidase YcbB/YkuD
VWRLPHRLLAAALAFSGVAAVEAQDSTRTPEVPERWLRLNIPAYRIDVLDGSDVVRSYRVAVGMRRYPTPVGSYAFLQVTWNPWWTPPRSEWAKLDTVTPPGPSNPLGKVKLRFDGLVFLHGTSSPSSIGRAASHACVRLRNRDAVALAREIQLRDSSDLPATTMDSILGGWEVTRAVNVKTPVRFEIVYVLAEVRDSALRFYPDIYRRGGEGHAALAMRALAVAGVDTLRVDRVAVDRGAARARERAVSLPLRSLIRRSP